MAKKEDIKVLASRLEKSQKETEFIWDEIAKFIEEELRNNPEKVIRMGNFKFYTVKVKERYISARTQELQGKKVEIPETTIPEHLEIRAEIIKTKRWVE